MKRLLNLGKSGFTIVEVMIVLAIAGVIMSTVFIAVPQLQRNSRDSQRQAIVQSVRSEIEAYAANNTGKYPLNKPTTTTDCNVTFTHGNFDDFYCNYIAKIVGSSTNQYKNDLDPSSGKHVFGDTPYTYQPSQCSSTGISAGTACPLAPPTATISVGQARIFVHAKCSGSQAISADGLFDSGINPVVSTRSYALVIGLERTNTYFCVDNS